MNSGVRNDRTCYQVENYRCMTSLKAPGGAIILDPDAPLVATDFVPFKMDNRFKLFGGRLNVGDNAGAETGIGCPWGGYGLCGITCNGASGPWFGMEC
jgi:hypothetical protein